MATSWDDHAECAKWVAGKLQSRDYEELNESFASELQVTLPASKIEQVMDQVESQIGEIVSIGSPKTKRVSGHRAAEVLCETESGRLLVRVVFNDENEIGGLWVFPGPAS